MGDGLQLGMMAGLELRAAPRGVSAQLATADGPPTPDPPELEIDRPGRRIHLDAVQDSLAEAIGAWASAATGEEAVALEAIVTAPHDLALSEPGGATVRAVDVPTEEPEAAHGLARLRRRERTDPEQAMREAQAERERREALRAQAQARLDDVDARRRAGDPPTLVAEIEAALEAAAAPAAPMDCDGGHLSLLVVLPAPGALPDRTLVPSRTAVPVVHWWSEADRRVLYRELLAAHTVAAVRQALAIGPTLERVSALVTRREPGRRKLVALWAGCVTRAEAEEPPDTLLGREGTVSEADPDTGELTALGFSDRPDLAELMARIVRSLHPVAASGTATAVPPGELAVAASKGSTRRVQELIDWDAERLERRLERWPSLADWRRGPVQWLFPVRANGFATPGEDVWKALELPRPTPRKDGFWPGAGPRWDAAARVPGPAGERGLLLVDAMSHEGQLSGAPVETDSNDREGIASALEQAKGFVGAGRRADWTGERFELASRLAFLYYLRERRGIPTWLLSVFFLGDEFESGRYRVTGPTEPTGWSAALAHARGHDLMLPAAHPLSGYVRDVFVPVYGA